MRLYNLNIPVIGVTGGVASGKSTVAQYFRDQNLLVLSADQIIKNLYKKQETFDWIQLNYSQFIEDSEINLKELSKVAFSNKNLLEELEDFLYPRMESEFISMLPKDLPSFVVYEIPLLFEKQKEELFDSIVLVTCSIEQQKKRLIERNQLTSEQAQNIINSQLTWDKKISKSHFIIDNSSSLKELEKKSDEVITALKEKFK